MLAPWNTAFHVSYHLRFPVLCCAMPQVMSASFSPDGSRAVTASKDGTMRIWKTDVRYQLQVCDSV